MTVQPIRSFIAVPLPDAAKETIETWLEELKQRQRNGVRWVDAAKMHLTMKFLGDIDPAQVPAIHQQMQAAVSQVEPFTIDLKGLGAFPGVYKPRVLWVGVEAPPALQQIHYGLSKKLAAMGFPEEDRKFSPHLTLGRISRHATEIEIEGVSSILRHPPKISLADIPVESLHLYRSDLGKKGSVYTLLKQAAL